MRSNDIFLGLQIKNTWSLRNDAVFDPKHKCQTKIKQKENPSSCKRRIDKENAQFGNRNSEFGSVSGQNAKPFSFHFMAQTIDNFRLFHFFSLINLLFSATENQHCNLSIFYDCRKACIDKEKPVFPTHFRISFLTVSIHPKLNFSLVSSVCRNQK